MKSLKMFAVAATLAVLAATGLVAASSAMAESTDLCTADENPCGEGNELLHLHEVSVGKGKLLSKLPTVECNVLFLGEAVGESSAVFNGKFTYSSCNNFCSVKEEGESELESTISFLRSGTELAEVTSGTEVLVSCPFTKCIYHLGTLEGHGLGPLTSSSANGSIEISEQEAEIVSGSCPEEAFLDLTTSPLSETFITQGGTQMRCEQVDWGRYLLFGNGTVCEDPMVFLWIFPLGRYELTNRRR